MKAVSQRDIEIFDRARLIAFHGEHARVRVGAILTKGRRTINTGFNRFRNNGDNVPYGAATWHAERQAVSEIDRSRCTLYVARIGLANQLLPSYPCQDCINHIVACSCVTKIVYYEDGEIRKVKL